MKEMSIFDEQYRVVAVESDRLLVRGILSGDVLTIINTEPETPSHLINYGRRRRGRARLQPCRQGPPKSTGFSP
jgi:hypothetical protein